MVRTRGISITLPARKPFRNVYQFKITLLETEPPVWRRIEVPESYTFYDLHVAIQDAMGWQDYHLHMFEMEDWKFKGRKIKIDCPFSDPEFDRENYYLTTETPLKRFFKKEGIRAIYTYDFGDNWEHEIVLENILPRVPKIKYPLCVTGELSCPPEDCGSIHGYYECIEALRNKKNKELLVWLGDWKPDNFDAKKVKFESPRRRLNLALGS